MSKNGIFNVLILLGRPASGKSEIVRYLQGISKEGRKQKYRLGDVEFIDDFPFLWTWYEEDHIRKTKLRLPQIHYDADGYFLHVRQWDLLIERVSLEYAKLQIDRPELHENSTVLVEFSRGSQHGGYTHAFQHLSPDLLSKAAILYVSVPFEESLRKNQLRFNPDRPYSILQHSLPDERLRHLYKYDDWAEFSANDSQTVHVNGYDVPYIVFENEDDVTTGYSDEMVVRLADRLDDLWSRWQAIVANR